MERTRPDINVTPLVDVVLVLLIIFMVVIPQMEAGAAVNVPGAANPDPKTSMERPITVSVTAQAVFFLEKNQVGRDELLPLLAKAHGVSPRSKLVLKADRDVPYGLVRALFRECQGLGFPGISLQVGDLRAGG